MPHIPFRIYPCEAWKIPTFPPQPDKGKAIFYIYTKGDGLYFANASDETLDYVIRDGHVRKEYPHEFTMVRPNEAVLLDVYTDEDRFYMEGLYQIDIIINSPTLGKEHYRSVENGMFSDQVVVWEKAGVTKRWWSVKLSDNDIEERILKSIYLEANNN